MRNLCNGLVLTGATLLVTACSYQPAYDPLYRDGLFQPTHVNRANLALMVANPTDLVRGTGRATADGQLAAAAVDRLRNDKVKKLPASDVSAVGATSSGENNASAPGGGSGAP
jgi:hypothetical protein